jgi:2-(1,2-epoxy-1,2-dihydrophenyl)acetyl-CoA isomerase
MKYETLTVTLQDTISYITLDRTDRLNAFDLKLGEELYSVLRDCAENDDIRAVVLQGSGKGFCSGGDVKEMVSATNKRQFLRDLTQAIHRCVIEIRSMAAINGGAYGAGLSLALACDIIIAIRGVKMNTAFIGIGLAPGCGTQFITQRIGYQKACEYILTAKTFSAEEAFKMGLVNMVVSAKNFHQTIETIVTQFRNLPPIAVGKAKMLINKSLENTMIYHLELESKTAAASAATHDFTEGITAFVNKRKPKFQGQ